MKLIQSAFDFIERLDEQKDVPSLLNAFQTLIGQFGFVAFCAGDVSHPKLHRADRLWGTTWPEEWLQRWFAKEYISVDPVLYQVLSQNVPFRWGEVRKQADELGARVMDEAREFKMRDGFGVPVYNRDGMVVGITMGTEHYELGKQEESCLYLAAIYFQARLERLRPSNTRVYDKPPLTRRERECLSWVAAGKTDWEISQIVGISQNTASEYVHSAMVKLNATTRAQAIALGMLTRQISV